MKGVMKINGIFLSLLILNFSYINCSFQSQLFSQLNQDFIGKNLIVSPFSVFQLLSLVANGANGSTKEAMLETLGFETIEDLNKLNFALLDYFKTLETFEVANAVMSKFTPSENFTEIAEKYSATVEPLESLEQVNGWCNKTTHGKIPTILDSLDDTIRMILLNGIYFKGQWVYNFEDFFTKESIFYNLNKEESTVQMMEQTDHFNYYEDEEIQMIQLPFQKDNMVAYVLLPNKVIDINDYINSFSNSKNLDTKLYELVKKMNVVKVDLKLPKFEVKFEQKLNDLLSKLGMGVAFSSEADFSGLTEEEKLKLEFIIHKTYLKVNEDGCEAAAITAGGMAGSGMPVEEKIYQMEVNRPFLFVLKNRELPENNDIMFMAKIEKL